MMWVLSVDVQAALHLVGKLVKWFSVAFLLPLIYAIFAREPWWPYALPGVLALVGGWVMERAAFTERDIRPREGFFVVALAWLLVAGLGGTPFTMLKFRSMYVDAERHTGPVWARKDDDRCTPLGRFMRRWSLDELPQLYNVLRGEMSLVGPRPERPFFSSRFRRELPRYALRECALPGLTGWAQVNGLRGDTSIAARLEYDLYYLRHGSLAFDARILWLTLTGSLRQAAAFVKGKA
ncbi:MAG: sugar transferase [Bryobacteraceae bacterium]|nr:sugar transferase [Bryobacteraceae bacterium]